MGQLFIVDGIDPVTIDSVFERGVAILSNLCGRPPCDELKSFGARVAKFPRLCAPTPGIARGEAPGAWTCPVGTPFFEGTTEVGLQALALNAEHTGLTCALKGINGIFAIAIGARDGSLILITDRLGTLHVYRANIRGCLVLCTSSLTLAALADADWDLEACREFLCTGTVFADRSLFVGITKLQPATVYRYNRGRETASRYWSVADAAQGMGATGSVGDLGDALQHALTRISGQYSRPVLDLTGGFDSRAILGAMMNTGGTFECVVNGAASDPDVLVSKRIASEFGLLHRHQTVRTETAQEWWNRVKASAPLCDGEFNVLLYAGTFDAHSRLAADFDITVNGSNGEVCKGYWWELLFPFTGRSGHFSSERIAAKRFAVDSTMATTLNMEFEDDLVHHFASIIDRANRGFEDLPNTAKLDNVYLTLRMQRWQGRIASATSRLWPCASPFMWREPMEIALSTLPRLRLRNRMSRNLIEHLNPKLARTPLAQGYPATPIRLTTVHLFAPLIAELAGKAIAKAHKVVFRESPKSSPRALTMKHLSDQEEFRSTLEVKNMLTLPLYNPEVLSRLMLSPPIEYAGRITTLELLARAVKGQRATETAPIGQKYV